MTARSGLDPLAVGMEVRLASLFKENSATKARRYVLESRLLVRQVSPTTIAATCRGDGDIYTLGYDRTGWHCSCPARGLNCCHLRALRLVTAAPSRYTEPPGGWSGNGSAT